MILYKKEIQEVKIPDIIVCDICDREFLTGRDDMELQEFMYIREIGGYLSVFGDGEEINYDICQRCFYKFVNGGVNE